MLLLAAMATSAAAGTVRSRTYCPANGVGGLGLESEEECRSVAESMGMTYKHQAGSEWHSGCIVHHGASLSFFPGTCTSSVTMISFFSSIV